VESHLQGYNHFYVFIEFTKNISSNKYRKISPVNDLLDKGEFTLEDLLEEDELIQEVKSKNERLIELFLLSFKLLFNFCIFLLILLLILYFSLIKDRTIDHLLDFIIYPAYPADTEKRTYKYEFNYY
jgi:hypothetical protein